MMYWRALSSSQREQLRARVDRHRISVLLCQALYSLIARHSLAPVRRCHSALPCFLARTATASENRAVEATVEALTLATLASAKRGFLRDFLLLQRY